MSKAAEKNCILDSSGTPDKTVILNSRSWYLFRT